MRQHRSRGCPRNCRRQVFFRYATAAPRRGGKAEEDVRAASQETCLRESPILRAGRAVERRPVVATDVSNRLGATSAMPGAFKALSRLNKAPLPRSSSPMRHTLGGARLAAIDASFGSLTMLPSPSRRGNHVITRAYVLSRATFNTSSFHVRSSGLKASGNGPCRAGCRSAAP